VIALRNQPPRQLRSINPSHTGARIVKALKVFGIVIVSLMLIPSTLNVAAAGLALSRAGDSSTSIGFFMGTLLAELVLLAIFSRLLKSLR
jgi:hypothetical protein